MPKLTSASRRRNADLRFANFLASTLVPDLRASGTDAAAQTFGRCARLIKAGKTDATFARWLRTTLGPDYKASGSSFMAADTFRCARILDPGRK
jgi:hypothetical protein